MSNFKITTTRRISQIIFFILLIYGGAIFLKGRKVDLPLFIASRASGDYKEMTMTKKAPPYNQPFELYLPTRSCRFARSKGMFRACTFHFFQEAISWHDPLRVFLPALFLCVLLGAIFGRILCGWVCPMGFIQDILAQIRKKLFKLKRIKLSEKTAKILRMGGYFWIYLSLIAAYTVTIKQLPWNLRNGLYLLGCQTCPSRIISSALTGYPVLFDVYSPLLTFFFIICILFTLLYLSNILFFERIWCKFCPMGIILSLFNKGKIFAKQKDVLKCHRCGVCADVCSMEQKYIYEQKDKKCVDHLNCINCFRCIEHCPEKDCLKINFLGMTIFKS